MLHLATLTILIAAAYIAMEADTLSPFFPTINSERRAYSDALVPEPISSSKYSVPSNSCEWCKRACNRKPAIVEYFVNSFTERVMACKKLREAFQIRHFNGNSLSSIYYDIVFKAISSVGGLDAPVSARIVSDAVATNFHKLHQDDDLLRIYADAVSDYLFYRGYLNPSNVASLSQDYFACVERSINSVKNPSPEANIRALGESFLNFFTSEGLFEPYSTTMVAGVFARQWYNL